MINDVQTYAVSIFGETYSLVSDEGKEVVSVVAQKVDAAMQEIATKMKHLDTKRIAILAAIKFVHELQLLENRIAKKDLEYVNFINSLDRVIASF